MKIQKVLENLPLLKDTKANGTELSTINITTPIQPFLTTWFRPRGRLYTGENELIQRTGHLLLATLVSSNFSLYGRLALTALQHLANDSIVSSMVSFNYTICDDFTYQNQPGHLIVLVCHSIDKEATK